MRRCKHKATMLRSAKLGADLWVTELVCLTCCDRLPLGPSRDTPETGVEMEAARLALHRIHDDWPDDEPEDEWADYGWAAYELGSDVYDGTWHGWLANHIVYEHEDLARTIAEHDGGKGEG